MPSYALYVVNFKENTLIHKLLARCLFSTRTFVWHQPFDTTCEIISDTFFFIHLALILNTVNNLRALISWFRWNLISILLGIDMSQKTVHALLSLSSSSLSLIWHPLQSQSDCGCCVFLALIRSISLFVLVKLSCYPVKIIWPLPFIISLFFFYFYFRMHNSTECYFCRKKKKVRHILKIFDISFGICIFVDGLKNKK